MAITRTLDLDPYAFAEGRLEPTTQVESAVLAPIYDEYASDEQSQQKGALPVPKRLIQAQSSAFMLRIQGNAMNRVLPPGFLALVIPYARFEAANPLYTASIDNAPAIVSKYVQHDNDFSLASASLDQTYQHLLISNADKSAPIVKPIGRVIWFCSPIGSESGALYLGADPFSKAQ